MNSIDTFTFGDMFGDYAYGQTSPCHDVWCQRRRRLTVGSPAP
jgi:hypothetical protein